MFFEGILGGAWRLLEIKFGVFKMSSEYYDKDGNFILDGDREKSMYSEVCCKCQHLTSVMRHRCRAFTGRIPDEIWRGNHDHCNLVAGDNGIQFKLR